MIYVNKNIIIYIIYIIIILNNNNNDVIRRCRLIKYLKDWKDNCIP